MLSSFKKKERDLLENSKVNIAKRFSAVRKERIREVNVERKKKIGDL